MLQNININWAMHIKWLQFMYGVTHNDMTICLAEMYGVKLRSDKC